MVHRFLMINVGKLNHKYKVSINITIFLIGKSLMSFFINNIVASDLCFKQK